SYRAAAEIIPVGIEPPALRSGRKAWRMDLSDHTRFEELVLPHLDAACNLARWLTRDVNDAEDVVQEACVRALKYVGSLNGGGSRTLSTAPDGRSLALAYRRRARGMHGQRIRVDARHDGSRLARKRRFRSRGGRGTRSCNAR